MQRRNFNRAGVSALGALIWATYHQAHALSLGDLSGISNADASAGLKTALEKGAVAAVALLGKTDGFLGKPLRPSPCWARRMDSSETQKFAFLCPVTWKMPPNC